MVITRELVDWNEDGGSIFIVYSSFTEQGLFIRTVKTGLATNYNHIPFNITEFDRFYNKKTKYWPKIEGFAHKNVLGDLQ